MKNYDHKVGGRVNRESDKLVYVRGGDCPKAAIIVVTVSMLDERLVDEDEIAEGCNVLVVGQRSVCYWCVALHRR